MEELLNHEFCKDVVERYAAFKKKEEENSFNVFSVSKNGNELENFHSDILSILFHQEERHGEGLLFVHQFMEYLNTCFDKNINVENYKQCICEREKGRIDLLIVDEESKHCIIIENKINDAPDMPDQLKRYYEYATDQRGLIVDAIVYLTLNGNKAAPLIKDTTIDALVTNIAFLNSSTNDMYTHWLLPCYEKARNNREASSFIYQYGVLLKHLSKLDENMELKQDFYNLISNKEDFKKMQALYALFNDLSVYRAQCFGDRLGENYKPVFKKNSRYAPYHWLYENYQDHEGIVFKLDVIFYKEYTRVDFWVPGATEEKCLEEVERKLNEICLKEDFIERGDYNRPCKQFHIDNYTSMEELDNSLYDYVAKFLKALETLERSKHSRLE
ncbi:PDDEXK-like family protein [Myroides odoratimimus]|uniref:PDDEXK-like family protein n=1 Tax=Myroides odoratimimus TaxID=76832 RepID=UPI002DBD4B63|nr:PD-(D/E)XK nuclease family protein [Myroides odoratimimus]MEC4094157.1 PD-(D/E)XK nuclease family protein [Myroides odoratimimus]